MIETSSLRCWALIVAQLLVAAVAFGVLEISPPPTGRYLIVPITPAAASVLVGVALAHGAALVARGPLPGSLIVSGDRGRLGKPLLTAHVLLVAAPAAGCGGVAL